MHTCMYVCARTRACMCVRLCACVCARHLSHHAAPDMQEFFMKIPACEKFLHVMKNSMPDMQRMKNSNKKMHIRSF